MRRRKRAALAVSGIGVIVVALAAWAGVAAAVSGGGYNPDQQDCQWNGSASNTPTGYTYPGCHNLAVNVESGGTTNGDPNSTNTRYVEFGNNQVPIDPNSAGTPTILSLGLPGNTGSPHSGCLAANTDGTGGGTGSGCGTGNSQGAGFTLNYDYYQYYCPLVAAVSPCEDTTPGTTTLTTNQGSAVDYNTVLSQGLLVYFGMDDNTDNGEHDGFTGINGPCTDTQTNTTYTCGSDGAINGPSDGGGMMIILTPQWAQHPTGAGSATHPEGVLNYSMGFCADGICAAFTTEQQTVYYGCGATNPQNNSQDDQCAPGTPSSDNVYENNAPASTSEPANCSSGDIPGESTQCTGGTTMNQYRSETPSQMNVEPGVQTYQDPDPQRSPASPIATPGTYVGTCGIYFNDSTTTTGSGTGIDPGYIVQPPGSNCG